MAHIFIVIAGICISLFVFCLAATNDGEKREKGEKYDQSVSLPSETRNFFNFLFYYNMFKR